MATFQFNDLTDFANWLERQSDSTKADAKATKAVRQQCFKEGQAYELKNLSDLIKNGSIVIKPPEVQKVYVQNEEKKEERPSAANNDFLMWVKRNYSARLYQHACVYYEQYGEEATRAELSRQSQLTGN